MCEGSAFELLIPPFRIQPQQIHSIHKNHALTPHAENMKHSLFTILHFSLFIWSFLEAIDCKVGRRIKNPQSLCDFISFHQSICFKYICVQ